jgi:hypothetical protein
VAEGVDVGSYYSTVDDAAILESVTARSYAPIDSGQQHALDPETTRLFFSALFADLPALEQLFDFGSLSASTQVANS